MSKKISILGISPHPDDIELLCGGTFAKYAKRGYRVAIASVTRGEKGSLEYSVEELARIRVEEAERAAKILNAEHTVLGLIDGEVQPTSETILKIVEAIRQFQADIIFTTSPQDYHPDHFNTAITTIQAAFTAGLPLLKTEYPAYTPSRVYYCDTLFAVNFEPDFWVDITETMDIKLRALQEHKSQLRWLKMHHDIDVVEDARVQSRLRGLQVGVKYAECFRQARKHMMMGPVDLPPI